MIALRKSVLVVLQMFLFFATTDMRAITWDPPVDLSAAGQGANHPQVSVDGGGNAVAVWARSNGPNNIIQASTLPFGGAWTVPVDLSAAGQNADVPQVSVDSGGNAVAVWFRYNGTDTIIQASTLPFGGAWTAPVDLSAAGQGANHPQVSVDSGGNAVAVWSRYNGANTIIQASTLPFGGAWTAPVDLSAAGRDANRPQVSVDSGGNAVAVWSRYNGANTIIQASTLPFGGTWTAPVDLSAAGQDANRPQVSVDSGGNAVAVWSRYNGANFIIQASTLPFGGAWTAPVDLSAAGQDAVVPQVSVDSGGNAVAVWSRSNGTNTIIQASTLSFGGAWTAPVDLSAAGRDADFPQVSVDSGGNAVAVWTRQNGANTIIQASTLSFGGAWTAPVDLSAAGQDANESQVGVDSRGNAVAVWSRNNGTNTIIQASIGVNPSSPPTGGRGSQVENRFAFQGEYFNSLQWNASPSSVANYRVYRNGVLIATVPASQLYYQDHLQVKGVAVTYGITALTSGGVESVPLIVVVP